ncbi:MAG: penicillin-binding protein 2 [Akkermansiaceae bacterium]
MAAPRYRYRLYLLTLLILVGTGVLLTRLYDFQIKQKDFYREKVPSNRTVEVREPGTRGDIKDRYGITLAQNKQSYIVYFNLAEIHKAYLATTDENGEPRNTLKRTVLVTRNGSKKKIQRIDIAGMVNETVRPKLAEYNLDADYSAKAMESHYNTHGGLVPFVYRKDLTYKEFAKYAEQNLQLPGVYIDVAPSREYPLGALASHVLGFIKPWKKGDIPDGYLHYIGDPYGEDGIEKSMNDELTGREGIKTILKNDKGVTLGIVDYQPPAKGSDIYLTLDARLQQITETILEQYGVGKGAAVVMDPNSGEILAMASVPNYNPNDFIPSITEARYSVYRENQAVPLMNRAISNFAPGSTFKLPAAIAGCKNGMHRSLCNCTGYTHYGSIAIGCWLTSGHGTLALAESLQRSCNPYFMNIANKIGYKKMVETYQMLGLGRQTGIRLPRENSGVVPGSSRWEKRYPNETMTDAFTGMMSIGQGYSQATPLQVASFVSTIANGGKYYRPRIVHRSKNELLRVEHSFKKPSELDLLQEGLTKEHLETIRYGMRLAANAPGGTAGRAKPDTEDVIIGAKTGTAQTTDKGVSTHVAWTAAFAPYEDPRYVVVVAVKRGGSGGKVAGPLVKLILESLFEIEKGKKVNLKKSKPYAGHMNLIEETIIPEESNIASFFADGETGDEASSVKIIKPKRNPNSNTNLTPDSDSNTPEPSITPEVDSRGSVKPIKQPRIIKPKRDPNSN